MSHKDFTVTDAGPFTTAVSEDGVTLHVTGQKFVKGQVIRMLFDGAASGRPSSVEEMDVDDALDEVEEDGIDLDDELGPVDDDDFIDQIAENEILITRSQRGSRKKKEGENGLHVTENQLSVLRYIRNNPGCLFGELLDGLADCGFDVNSSLRKLITKGLVHGKQTRGARGNVYTVAKRLSK